MIKDIFVVDASAHSYNLGEDNYAVGRYSQTVVDAFYGAHYGLSPVGYRLPREQFTRDWTVAETAKMLYVESTRVPLSIIEMGMVEKVEIAAGAVVVALRMTSPLCHALPYFQMEIERVLAGVPGIEGVKCTFDNGGNWQPDDMTAGAQRKLADQRELVRRRAGQPAKAA
jgi:metal-sulfur cluster biosynthetic enzyme